MQSYFSILVGTKDRRPLPYLKCLKDDPFAFRQLSKREAFVDLEFVCADGSLFCHKFIIGAQSRFLRQIMLKLDDDQVIGLN